MFQCHIRVIKSQRTITCLGCIHSDVRASRLIFQVFLSGFGVYFFGRPVSFFEKTKHVHETLLHKVNDVIFKPTLLDCSTNHDKYLDFVMI